jgi:type III restriction enzyme
MDCSAASEAEGQSHMKLQFKHQKFQADAANAVCDIFRGQRLYSATYLIDRGVSSAKQDELSYDEINIGIRNHAIEISDKDILANLRSIQKQQMLRPDDKIESYSVEIEDPITGKNIPKHIKYNFTVEMETGVGKTYTYIKTMHELNVRYGWSKFIIIVPSVAIREGVYKSFEITRDHFLQEYGKQIRCFIYNSSRLDEIDHFAQGAEIKAMIINSQAFNARGKDARRIYMRLDSFASRRPIDIIAAVNPILIIDEPQSVEGKQTKNSIGWFNPLFILRYSATPKNIYNLAYRLDAMEAYNKKLVKKISVKGISESGSTATTGYLYLQRIVLSKDDPAAYLEFETKTRAGIRKVTRKIYERNKFNLYDQSNRMEEYRDNFIVTHINGVDNSISFLNGQKLRAGEVSGEVNEDQLRRIQIRETILSHLEREMQLFNRGIKVLSLFFIDEVAKYKKYNEAGDPFNGDYADVFEEEYNKILREQRYLGHDAYYTYLDTIIAKETHAGYFSIDKDKRTGKERFRDSSVERGSGEAGEAEKDAFDLIIRNKERLLDLEEPVRFIFSHSALREGWDNTNVFQICTLKKSSSDIRKRQEVGRGLRLCVNQNGERMDAAVLSADVHSINVLTVIANESYEDFTRQLQSELAEAVSGRPLEVSESLFAGQVLHDAQGQEWEISERLAKSIYRSFLKNDYIDDSGQLTEFYYEAKETNAIKLPEEVADCASAVYDIVDSVFNPKKLLPEDGRKNNVEVTINNEQFARREFQELWRRINAKSAYTVQFDTNELINNAVKAIDNELSVSQIRFAITQGEMNSIRSREALEKGEAFEQAKTNYTKTSVVQADNTVKFDLIGKIAEETGLTRRALVAILKGIAKEKFALFSQNPEEFIIKVSRIINEQKATAIVQYIEYTLLTEKYDSVIFTDPALKGRIGINALPLQKHLYDYLIYDSETESRFAVSLDNDKAVTVFVKLPKSFYINTPVGNYSPDWAIAFEEGTVKHIYFVAETKGSMSSLELRKIEEAKIACARKHFAKIGAELVLYDKIDSYETLLNKVMR